MTCSGASAKNTERLHKYIVEKVSDTPLSEENDNGVNYKMCYEATVIEPDGAICLNRKHYCLHLYFNHAVLKNYPLWDEHDFIDIDVNSYEINNSSQTLFFSYQVFNSK